MTLRNDEIVEFLRAAAQELRSLLTRSPALVSELADLAAQLDADADDLDREEYRLI